ncbi:F-box/FBD/LRR-repeat protein At5g53840-like [Diospyros lotus]|uniref:F-box/FBD/LRR-repeat protein At5g53840-like n=1 Tax=Diospyros lotus TaxID=55363 RepID=UPI0022596111|nr:F-box/FBD/LRR-repeat protein At5g53840-like [Diospyros lotus]
MAKGEKPRKVYARGKRRKLAPELEDRISLLPDEILVIILSSLSIKEAARTSILSSRWRELWTLGITLDLGSLDQVRSIETRTGQNFSYWLDRIMESHKGPSIQKLRICLQAKNIESGGDFARWMNFATRKFVRELYLQVETTKYSVYPSLYLGFYNFHSLKALFLDFEHVDARHVEHFLSHCPSLEKLSLAKSNVAHLKISGPSLKLKFLEVSSCFNLTRIKISAPNLVAFKYWGPEMVLDLENAPLLAEVSFLESYCMYVVKQKFEQFSTVLPQLQKITLTLSYPWMVEFPMLDGLANLSKLELNLRVWDYDNPFQLCTSFIKALPFLNKISLNLFWVAKLESKQPWEPEVEDHRQHCLKVVELIGFVGCLLDLEIVRYMIRNASSLKKITLCPCRRAWMDDLQELMTIKEKQEARQCAHELEAVLSPHTKLVVL